MEPFKIFIENWPSSDLVALYTPICIAAVAVIVSWYSAHLSRRSFNLSSRPYVWASNYGVIDQTNRTITPIPWRLGYRVKNSPAQVIENIVSIKLGSVEIFSHKGENFVRFPDESSEWTFTIGEDSVDPI
ncbi:hypothetical protein [Shewanella surugensis]|uniref:Uncharacterized protein n=1 Tax=Shewanella surugensis TaxID=212020 RepID=A0ABT0LJ66_9GAMM|nr:hypothetical protein [Shewanella surugensis]MCL1127757.1 hypothetical protein [Shewanella surugensis]